MGDTGVREEASTARTTLSLEGALGLTLVGAGVVDQRCHAVMEVLAAGVPVMEVAERCGVARETVHTWLDRYRDGGLADRSHRARGRMRGWCPPSAMSSAIAFAFPEALGVSDIGAVAHG